MSKPWVEHVRKYAKDNNISYMCAISDASKTYNKKKQTKDTKETKQTKETKEPTLKETKEELKQVVNEMVQMMVDRSNRKDIVNRYKKYWKIYYEKDEETADEFYRVDMMRENKSKQGKEYEKKWRNLNNKKKNLEKIVLKNRNPESTETRVMMRGYDPYFLIEFNKNYKKLEDFQKK